MRASTAIWIALVLGAGAALVAQHRRVETLRAALDEKTGEFNGCLDSFNFCEHKLLVCREEPNPSER
jgi:hypothetical protein